MIGELLLALLIVGAALCFLGECCCGICDW
jgi:hypothetical protein